MSELYDLIMGKINFNINEYEKVSFEEKLNKLREIFFEHLDIELIAELMSDEQIENIYNETRNKIQSQFLSEYEQNKVQKIYLRGFVEQERLLHLDNSEYRKLFLLYDDLAYRKYDGFEDKYVIRIDTIGYKVFTEFKKFIINTIEKKETELTIVPENKIISNVTNLQAIGYLFTKLIQKGLIELKYRNGKVNQSGSARMILEHYHFKNLDKQPTEEDIRKTLFEDNKLSDDKVELFKFPTVNQLNSK